MRISGVSGGRLTISAPKYDSVVPGRGRVVPMGTIVPRKRKNNTTGFTAQIVIKRGGQIVHREARTFDRRQAAADWMERREKVLRETDGVAKAKRPDATLEQAIGKYVEESLKEIGRTKAQVLNALKGYDIAKMNCADITSADIVDLATALSKGRTPQTVGNYLSHLGAIFAIARPAWGYQLDETAMRDAMKVLKRLGKTSKSLTRSRRPTLDELDRLMSYFMERRAPSNPMHRIIAFALFSTRRQDEIVRIRWSDLDEAGSRVLVRDMKNPGQKIGNDVWCDLPEPALKIIQAMPRTGKEIFPFSTDALSAAFTRACHFLEIEDLHFHDLRHEGVSRLFEMGMNIPHAAAVSGHRSWTSLKRYTHLRDHGDKYAGWKWLPVVTSPSPPFEQLNRKDERW